MELYELVELTKNLEAQEVIKFEIYNCLRKDDNETPSEFKARRNERIRKEYNLGGVSIKELAEKYGITEITVKRVIKGIKKVKKLAYIDKRFGRLNHTESYKEFLSEKIKRDIELAARNKVKPLPIDEFEYEVVPYTWFDSCSCFDVCYLNRETGELCKAPLQGNDDTVIYRVKSSKAVKKATVALDEQPDIKQMASLYRFCLKLRSWSRVKSALYFSNKMSR